MKFGSLVAYPFAAVFLGFACSAESRPFESIIKSFNILSEQSPLRHIIMGSPEGQVSTGVIISDVIGKTQNIAIFSSLTRDTDAVSGRLDDAAQNATVLAPDNSVMRSMKRKPWEDPEDYESLGTNAYAGSSGEDRARKNLERFVQSHIVPQSPWEEGKKVKTLAGNEVWWEMKDNQKKVSPELSKPYRQRPLVVGIHFVPTANKIVSFFTTEQRIFILSTHQSSHQSNKQRVRWPSWLWR